VNDKSRVQDQPGQGPRVLFVSKPIAPPWHDGSKNLVRDVASHLTQARATVMTLPGTAPLSARVTMDPVYTSSGSFAPGLTANARVLRRLCFGDPLDIWHFVFAPNPASSSAARLARQTRRLGGFRGPVVQTIASAPREFAGISRWIFGDRVIVLSEWMRGRLIASGIDATRLTVIPPCAAAPDAPSAERRAAARALIDADGPVLLYPGDYEVSRGAQTVADAATALLAGIPDATLVFACRPKSPRAHDARRVLEASLLRAGVAERVRHVGEVNDMAALVAESALVLFPVDDLYGKVDVPLVLLEALALGIPMVLASEGPLEAVSTARFAEPGDAGALAETALDLYRSSEQISAQRDAGRALHAERFAPSVVAAEYDALYASLTR
jgi:phosphatidylinositol alpha-1,6-mannosyltransferase